MKCNNGHFDKDIRSSGITSVVADYMQENKDTLHYAQAYNTLGTVQQIKWEKRRAETKWYNAVGNILSKYSLADSTQEMHDTIFSFLVDTLGTKPFKKLAVGYGLEIGKFTESRTLLDSLNLVNAADSSFYNYYDLAVSLAEDTLTWFSMDSLQRENIIAIAADTIFDEHLLAQAVLSLILDTTYIRFPEPLPEDSAQYRMEPKQQLQPQEQTKNQVKVYPNPFINNFNILYNLEEEADELKIEVFDMVGRNIKQEVRRKVQNGNMIVELGQCLGVHFVRVTNGSKQLFNGKMICLTR